MEKSSTEKNKKELRKEGVNRLQNLDEIHEFYVMASKLN